MTSLVDPGDDGAIQSIVESMQDESRGRMDMLDEQERLREGENRITWPAGTPPEAMIEYHGGMPASQIGLVHGIMLDMPTIKVFHDGTNAGRAEAEKIENWGNNIWPTLEMQAGQPVWDPVLYDVLTAGYGVDVLEFLPSRLTRSNGFPDQQTAFDTGEAADRYIKARQSAKRRNAGAFGKLPLVWRHVPARDFLFRESADSNNLALAVECRVLALKDVLEDDRYKDKLPKLRAYYSSKSDQERASLRGARVLFYIVEDAYWTTYFVMAPELANLGGGMSPTTLGNQMNLARDYGQGEIADQFPNVLGRPRYVLTRGLSVVSSNPSLKYRGIMWDLRHLIKTRDHLISWSLALEKLFAFPAPVLERTAVRQNGVEVDPSVPNEDPGGQRDNSKLLLHPGGNELTELEYGEKISFITPEASRTRDGLLAIMGRDADLQTIPSSVFSVDGNTAGYTYNSLLNTVLARLKGVMRNIRIGHRQRTDTAHDVLRLEVKESLTVAMSDEQAGTTQWLDLSPDDLAREGLNVVPLYKLERQQDEMQKVQVFLAKTTPGREMVDVETARAEAGYESHEKIEKALLSKRVLDQPKVQELILQKGGELALQIIDQKLADERGVLPDLMQKLSPGLAAAIGLSATPDGQNQGAAESYAADQMGGQQMPPDTTPPANPQVLTPVGGGTGGTGRQAGQSGLPGGPNLQGGLPPS